MTAHATDVRSRQDPLRKRYLTDPAPAMITDHARTVRGTGTDPFHGHVRAGSRDYGIEWDFGIHDAVGGDHDAPNPGDILAAALATCLDSTVRMIADRLGMELKGLEVDVEGRVDVRGTLVVDKAVPVGFQEMRCRVHVEPAPGTDPQLVSRLLAAAEHSCVNLQTLRSGVPVSMSAHVA